MSKRKLLSVLAVSAAASAVLGGVPAAVIAATAVGASATTDSAFGGLPPALAAQLSKNADRPVIVVLKNQFGQATAGTPAATARSAAVSSSQSALLTELSEVHATGIKRFTLVNAVAATVSAAEAQRLAANGAVSQVIGDATVSIPASALGLPTANAAPATAGRPRIIPDAPARTTSLPLRNLAGACAPKGRSYLAPEGLGLTNTVSSNSNAATARSLGFTGAGVKVAFIADGVDPGNVNFIAKNGKSVFVDYQDFTGDGAGAPTDGGEAFLDANTIAGQGTHIYNLNGFAAQGYPNSCDVKIEGVAPGASLVGLDIFSGDPSHAYITTNSMIAEAINYAVEHDHVNVINESFGDNEFPDTTQDVIKLFDNAAVAAGTVVAASSGDSGTMSTIGSPATDPAVISVGASTQFQMYAQSNFGLARYFSTGWLDDNTSGLSSTGYTEQGATVDLVAPGDLSWASCDANTARFSDCSSLLGNPSSIEISGGTSESSPFVAGAAALVIQAYRTTHDGSTPAPALVKQILLSTATDLGIPSQEQGAGLLNSYHAVQLAESIGRSARTGSTLLESATQLDYAGLPGTSKSWAVTLTNTGSKTQAVSLRSRTLGPDRSKQSGTVTLKDATSDQLIDYADYPDNYAVFHFTVPASQSRLDVSIAYPADSVDVIAPVSLTLIDPKGRYAANSDPQGIGNYGNADVRTPAAGTWTAIVNDVTGVDGGFTGAVSWQAVTERFISFGTVSPSTTTIAPGASTTVTYTATAPAAAGDYAAALEMSSSLGGPTSIPVVLRSLVNPGAGGAFSGVLTGGNGRPGNVGEDNYFSFTVPPGTGAVSAALALASDPLGGTGGVSIGAYLVSPDGNVVGSGQNYDITQGDERDHRPAAGGDRAQARPGQLDADRELHLAHPRHRGGRPVHRDGLVRPGRPAGGLDAARQREQDAAGRGGEDDPGDDHQHRDRARGLLPRPAAGHHHDDDAGADHPRPRQRVEHVDAAARRGRAARVLGALALDVGHGQAELDPAGHDRPVALLRRPRRRVGGPVGQLAVRHAGVGRLYRSRRRRDLGAVAAGADRVRTLPDGGQARQGDQHGHRDQPRVRPGDDRADRRPAAAGERGGRVRQGQPGHRRGQAGCLGHPRRDDQAVRDGRHGRQRHALPR